MATTLEEMKIKIGAEITHALAGMRQVSKAAMNLGKDLTNVGKTITTSVTLPIAGAGIAAVKFASDTEEMLGKFNAVFRDNAGEVEDWAKAFARDVGRSRFAMMEMASGVQDTFVPLGFAREEAAKMSTALTELAVDVASFNNASEPETMQLFTSALVGNHEAVRRFGIVITEATLKQELARMGADKLTGAQLEQAKVQARMNLIMASTSDAHGDAARTSGSLANQWRALTSEIKDMAIELGTTLMPYARQFITWARDAVAAFQELSPHTKAMIVTFAGIAAAAGPLLISLGVVTTGVGLLTKGFVVGMTAIKAAVVTAGTAIVKVFAAITSPIGLAVTAVTAAGVALYAFRDTVSEAVIGSWKVIKLYLQDNFNKVAAAFQFGLYEIGRGWEKFQSIFTDGVTVRPEKTFADFLSDDLTGDLEQAQTEVSARVRAAYEADMKALVAGLTNLKESALSVLSDMGLDSTMVDTFTQKFDELEKNFAETGKKLSADAEDTGENVGNALAEAMEPARDASKRAFNSMEDELTRFTTTGKISVGSLIDTIISEFMRLQIVKPFLSMLGLGSDSFLGIFGGGGGGGGVTARASGGRVNPGMPVLTGERRPELWVPDRPGKVLNGHDTEVAMRSGGNTFIVDARGSTNPEETRAQVMSAMMEFVPMLSQVAEGRIMNRLSRPAGAY